LRGSLAGAPMLRTAPFRSAALAAVGIGLALVSIVPGAWRAFAQAPAPAPPAAPPAPPTGAPAAPVVTTRQEMETVFDEFFKVGLDVEKPLALQGFVLKRDTMELKIDNGTLWLAQPIAGRITGACFVGSATLRVTLPNPIDRKLLKSTYGKPAFEESLN